MAIVSVGATGFDLFEHSGTAGEKFNPTRIGLDHLGFAVDPVEDLHTWAARLEECGVVHSEVREILAGDTAGVSREPLGAMLDFLDPDGIQLEFLFLDEERIRQAAVYRSGQVARTTSSAA